MLLEQARIASVARIVDLPLADPKPGHRAWLKILPRPVKTLYAVGVTSLSLLAAACGPEAKPPSQPNVSAQSAESRSEISFDYPFSGLWYLSAGPHSDGSTNGVRAALDFAQPEVVACPGGKPVENRFVEASASGKIAVVGNEKDPTDKNHSLVEIDHGQGLRTGYMHLANMLVNVGQEVKQGERLGNPSCEKPSGGDTSGIHLHWYAKKDGKFLPADGIKFPQGQIKASPTNKDGTLIGPDNLVRTADKRRCGPNEDSIKACGGIRNDLDKGAVLGVEAKLAVAIKQVGIRGEDQAEYWWPITLENNTPQPHKVAVRLKPQPTFQYRPEEFTVSPFEDTVVKIGLSKYCDPTADNTEWCTRSSAENLRRFPPDTIFRGRYQTGEVNIDFVQKTGVEIYTVDGQSIKNPEIWWKTIMIATTGKASFEKGIMICEVSTQYTGGDYLRFTAEFNGIYKRVDRGDERSSRISWSYTGELVPGKGIVGRTREPRESIFPPLATWVFIQSLGSQGRGDIGVGRGGYNLVEGEVLDFTEAVVTLTDGALKTTKPFPIQGCEFIGSEQSRNAPNPFRR